MTDAAPDHEGLDPTDRDAFRAQAHALLEACLDHLEAARERPWRPVSEEVREALMPPLPRSGIGEDATAKALAALLPHGTGNTHPGFFGWVHGTGTHAGLLAEMAAAAINANLGGRDHGANYVERAVIGWAKEIFGFPETGSGVLTTGTSQATVIALAAARLAIAGPGTRKEGITGGPGLTAYCAAGAHNAMLKAVELLGHGSDSLRRIPLGADGAMDLTALRAAIAEDRAAGHSPFAVIGTAGSVDTGTFDDFNALADLVAAEGLWLHVDGAFGAWARIAGDPWRGLAAGIERAHSLAFDFHKWMYVQYDCGAVLIRDEAAHRAAFAARPSYLEAQDAGLGGGEPWFCDYGIDLSRGFRALKVWSTLRAYGLDRLGNAIAANCRHAAHMGALVEAAPELALAAPVCLNLCCFRVVRPDLSPEEADTLHRRIAIRLQEQGTCVFSTTTLQGRTALRAAIVNHRTRLADVERAVEGVRKTCGQEF
ncbi:MAG: pyridoxal-dependent decarboxylase [Pseudomonadota bacterium]